MFTLVGMDNGFQERDQKLMNKLILILIVLIATTVISGATTISTNAASDITTKSVTMNGDLTLTDPSAQVWFEWTGSSGYYKYKTTTRTKTVSGVFSQSVSGIPLMAHQTFYYRSVAKIGSTTITGAEQSFTLNPVTPITEYKFDNHTQDLTNNFTDPLAMVSMTALLYTDIMGTLLFYGMVFATIMGMIWMRQQDMLNIQHITLITGFFFLKLLPPEWTNIAYLIIVLSVGSIGYTWYKGRQ